jgi:hypothetical protein
MKQEGSNWFFPVNRETHKQCGLEALNLLNFLGALFSALFLFFPRSLSWG